MQAAVRRRFGTSEVVALEEIPTPTPGPKEVLIRVRAASPTLGDWELLTGRPRWITVLATLFVRRSGPDVPARPGDPRGWRRPKFRVLGSDFAGVVEAVGAEVTRYRVGDEVFGDCGESGFGAFAEFVCLPETATIARKPPELLFEAAATLAEPGLILLSAFRDLPQLRPGARVLVNGAGGGTGTLAVQHAKGAGAHVTGVDAGAKRALVTSLGADAYLDYAEVDFADGPERYDVVFDMVGTRPMRRVQRVLTDGGVYLIACVRGGPSLQAAFFGWFHSRIRRGRVRFVMADYRVQDLEELAVRCVDGRLRPALGATLPLAETAEALRLVGEGRGLGNVVVTMGQGAGRLGRG